MGLTRWLGSAAGTLVCSYQARVKALTANEAMGQSMVQMLDKRGSAASPLLVSDGNRFATSDDVFAAVTLLATTAAGIPLRVYVGDEPDPEHDLQLLLDRGNRIQHGLWLQWAYSWDWLTGESFTYINHAQALPTELWPMSGKPWVVKAGSLGADWPIQYGYVPDGKVNPIPIDPGEVSHSYTFNPGDALRGLSPLSSLRLGLDAEAAANAANRDIFKNGALLDSLISAPGMTETQRGQLDRAIRGRHVGNGQQHGFLVVSSAVEVSPLALTPRDAEFINLQKLTTTDVAKAYQIPPMFLGVLDDATYSNYNQAWRSLISLAVLPGVRRQCAALTAALTWQYPDFPTVRPDEEAVEMLLEDAESQATLATAELTKAQTVSALVTSGWDVQQAAKLVYGQEVVDEMEWPEPADEPAPDPDPVPDAPMPEQPVKAKAERTNYAMLSAAQIALEPSARRDVDAGLQAQAEAVLAAIDRMDSSKAILPGDPIAVELQRAVDGELLMPSMVRVWDSACKGGASATATVGGLEVRTGRVDFETAQFIAETGARRVALINDETQRLIRDAVYTAYEEGEGISGVRTRVAAAFGKSDQPEAQFAYSGRVDNIAATESSRAFGHGTLVALKDAGVEWHEWQSSHLPNSRHGGVDGQRRKVGDYFDVRGHRGRYPSAEELPPGEACRCHCVTIPVDGPGDQA